MRDYRRYRSQYASSIDEIDASRHIVCRNRAKPEESRRRFAWRTEGVAPVPAVVLVGAGSMMFTRQTVSDLLQTDGVADGLDLRLVDVDPERLESARALCEGLIAESGARATVRADTDLRSALTGAGYVVVAIQVGGYAATRLDFDVPARFGVRQTIGDTLGIGGISRALRTIPAVVDIARAVSDVAPDAVVLNYTNPLDTLVAAVARIVGLEIVGLCHSPYTTAVQLADYLDVPIERLGYRVAGINHQAWVLELTLDGADAYPALERAMARPEVYDRDRVRFELLRHLGYFVTESSEHNAEYFPYFLRSDAEIERLMIPVGEYLRRSVAFLADYRRLRRDVTRSHARHLLPRQRDYAVETITALALGGEAKIYANVVNRELIANLPGGAGVEVPAAVRGGRVVPEAVGSLPTALAAWNHIGASIQLLVVEAVATGRREPLYEAAMLDPNVASTLRLPQVPTLVDELVAAHADSIPDLRRVRSW
jgi:alpha-galactosidase